VGLKGRGGVRGRSSMVNSIQKKLKCMNVLTFYGAEFESSRIECTSSRVESNRAESNTTRVECTSNRIEWDHYSNSKNLIFVEKV
jgi:hypothetical protein